MTAHTEPRFKVWLVAAAVARRDYVVACDGQILESIRHAAKIDQYVNQESRDYPRSDGGLVSLPLLVHLAAFFWYA